MKRDLCGHRIEVVITDTEAVVRLFSAEGCVSEDTTEDINASIEAYAAKAKNLAQTAAKAESKTEEPAPVAPEPVVEEQAKSKKKTKDAEPETPAAQ